MPAGRRIIFLDVDGVLNHFNWRWDTAKPALAPGAPQSMRRAKYIDPAAVTRLNALVARSGAEVVLSSSWRTRLTLPEMQAVLDSVGFESQLVARTPVPNEHDPAVHRRWAGGDPPSDRPLARGFEIQQWLDAHDDVCGLVILDDIARMAHLVPWLVRTSTMHGLQDEHIDEALARLELPMPVLAIAPRTRR